MILHLRDGFEQMKSFLEHRAVNYLPTVLPIGKFYELSIHAFLTGIEWFIWLVKGR